MNASVCLVMIRRSWGTRVADSGAEPFAGSGGGKRGPSRGLRPRQQPTGDA